MKRNDKKNNLLLLGDIKCFFFVIYFSSFFLFLQVEYDFFFPADADYDMNI